MLSAPPGIYWHAGAVTLGLHLNRAFDCLVGGRIGPQLSVGAMEVKNTYSSCAPTINGRERNARPPLFQSSSGRGYRLGALALVVVALALVGCGTSSSGSSSAAGRRTNVVKDQPRGKHQRQECALAAREIARTEIEHVKEVVGAESSEARELEMRIGERESIALSKCKLHH